MDLPWCSAKNNTAEETKFDLRTVCGWLTATNFSDARWNNFEQPARQKR